MVVHCARGGCVQVKPDAASGSGSATPSGSGSAAGAGSVAAAATASDKALAGLDLEMTADDVVKILGTSARTRNTVIMSPSRNAEPKYDLISPAFFADPHPTFRRMRAEDPVYWHPTLRMWFLVRYDDIQRVARDPQFTAMRDDHFGRDAPPTVRDQLEIVNRFLAGFLLFNDAPTHTRLRNLIVKAFAPKVIDALRPFIKGIVEDRIEAALPLGQMEVIEQLARPLPSAVIARMLGIPGHDIHRFKGWTDDLFALVGSSVATAELVERGTAAS